MELGLKDKVAVITGSGRGLGRAMALAFAEAGAHIVAVARTQEQLEETAALVRERGRRCLVAPADITDSAQVNAAVERAAAEFGRLDILINNAGGRTPGFGKSLPEITDEEWRLGIDANLTGAFYCTRAIVPHMLSGGGKILNIASGYGLRGGRHNYIYACAKAALVNFTRSLALTYARDNIQANCLAPGIFPMTQEQIERWRGGVYIPVGRVGKPEEIGPLAVFLCSAAASYINGCVVSLDGGGLAGGQAPTGLAPLIALPELPRG